MLVMRMNRIGRRNRAFFRVAVQEKTVAPGGRHVEMVGSWDPHKKQVTLKKDRIAYWLEKGVQPSDTVYNLLVSQGVIEGKKRSVKMERPVKKEEVKEESAEEAKPEEGKVAEAEIAEAKEEVKLGE